MFHIPAHKNLTHPAGQVYPAAEAVADAWEHQDIAHQSAWEFAAALAVINSRPMSWLARNWPNSMLPSLPDDPANLNQTDAAAKTENVS